VTGVFAPAVDHAFPRAATLTPMLPGGVSRWEAGGTRRRAPQPRIAADRQDDRLFRFRRGRRLRDSISVPLAPGRRPGGPLAISRGTGLNCPATRRRSARRAMIATRAPGGGRPRGGGGRILAITVIAGLRPSLLVRKTGTSMSGSRARALPGTEGPERKGVGGSSRDRGPPSAAMTANSGLPAPRRRGF